MSSSGAPGTAPHPSLPARPPVSAAVSSASTAHNSANSSAAGTPTMTPKSATLTPSASSAAANGSSYGPNQPRLGYSRTYASNTSNTNNANSSTPAAASQSTYTNYYNNSKYPLQTPAQGASYGPTVPTGYRPPYGQQQPLQAPASYGPQAPASYGSQTPATYGPQAPSYGPQAPASTASYGQVASAAPHIRNPFPQQPHQQNGRGGNYRQNNTSWQSGAQQGAGAGAGAAATGYQNGQNGQYNNAQYGPYYSQPPPPQQQQHQQQQHYPGYGPYYPDDPAVTAAAVAAAAAGAAEAANTDASGEKKQTVYRSGGGKQWADDTLLEWDPSHLRLFVGNLAGEVTDETLFKAFSRWKSVQKALVKRDKWTKKSRGYGFVSFSDPDDFFQAAKEMNGKYIGSHPVVVRKSKTEIKVSTFKDDSRGRKKKNNNNKTKTQDGKGAVAGVPGNAGSGVGSTAPRKDEASHKAMPSGVHKPGKTKNGLKLLG